MWIDKDLRIKYFDKTGFQPYGDDINAMKKKCSHKLKDWAKGDITDVMVSIGACWFQHRDRYWELEGLDEGHGSWGQVAVEIAMKAWLSGGRQVVNKKTWFAHLPRTQPGFSWPYENPAKDQEKARQHSKDMWFNNKWSGQKHNLGWLIDKFSPLPGWESFEESIPLARYPFSPFSTNCILGKRSMSMKGLIYYTDNQCEERIADIVRKQINSINNGYPIVSVSQYPINFGKNIIVSLPRSILSMFKQMLTGLENIDTDIVFFVEHDILYHPSHFEFTPPKKDIFYYNVNTWKVRPKDGQALFYYSQQVSGLCAYRDLLLEHYRKRIGRVEREGFTRRLGFEPGNHPYPRGVDHYKAESWRSEHPNVDIRHGKNVSGCRFKKDEFRREPKEWQLADEIPFWGKTKGRFDEFLRDILNG